MILFLHLKMCQSNRTMGKPKDNTVDENDNTIPDREIVEAEIKSIIESISDEDEWIFLGTLGNMLLKRIPGFDPRNYGYKVSAK